MMSDAFSLPLCLLEFNTGYVVDEGRPVHGRDGGRGEAHGITPPCAADRHRDPYPDRQK
jgi:hypothetical protein